MILICAILSFSVVGLTIYGSQVGNFVISISDTAGISILLSEHNDFDEKEGVSTLYAPGLTDAWDTTFVRIKPPEEFNKLEGEEVDNAKRYMAYGFYLKNTSDLYGEYRMSINLEESFLGVVNAVRIMVITDKGNGPNAVIYGEPSADGGPINGTMISEEEDYEVTPFVRDKFNNQTNIIVVPVNGVSSGQIVKYTVVMWLEGYDPECTDAIRGGSLRVSMTFTGTVE